MRHVKNNRLIRFLVTSFGKGWKTINRQRDDLARVNDDLAIANEGLRKGRVRSDLILNSAGEGICGLDLEGNITFVNPAAAKMVGWEAEELIGQPHHDIFHYSNPDGTPYPQTGCLICATLKRGAVHRVTGGVFWRKDGTNFRTEYISSPALENGALAGSVLTFKDITERSQVEEKMQQYAERLRVLHELDRALTTSLRLPDIYHAFAQHAIRLLHYDIMSIALLEGEALRLVYVASEDGGQSAFPAGATLPLKTSSAGWVVERGQPLLRHNIVTDTRFAEDERLVAGGIRSGLISPLRVKGRVIGTWNIGSRKVGTYDPDDMEIAQTMVDQLANAIENARLYKQARQEISERKQVEEQLRQSQKMEAIGKLAGGIAHDFNNLLTVISGYSILILHGYPDLDETLRRDIEQIVSAGEQAASLTKQLLAFSHKQVLQPEVLDLNAVVSSTDNMLRRLIGEDIDLVTVLEPRPGRIKADPGQMKQVILNLVVNARDAMPHGGKLTIETANVYLDEGYGQQHVDLTPGPYLMLAVSDTGSGIDQEIISQIFEPFFTTKEKDKGTGLGLSTVYGIIKQSGGHINVYSEPGQGTTFKIYLPCIEDLGIAPKVLPDLLQSPRGSETILLVEDEDEVRALIRQILLRNGYIVLEASQGEEALKVGEAHEGTIDLLLTDMVMPGGMSGNFLADRITMLYPQIKVLYMSGYTDQGIVRHGVLKPGLAFVQKPFSPEVLLQKVQTILNETR